MEGGSVGAGQFGEQRNKYIEEIFEKASDYANDLAVKRYRQPVVIVAIIAFQLSTIFIGYVLVKHAIGASEVDFFPYMIAEIAYIGLLMACVMGLAWAIIPLEKLFKTLYAKVLASLLISICIWGGKLLTIEFFSTHFPFSVSYMPVAYATGVFLEAFAFSTFAFVTLAAVFQALVFAFSVGPSNKTPKFIKYTLLTASTAGFATAYLISSLAMQGLSPKGHLFLLNVAARYDFTKNHMCAAEKNEDVLFIDNVSDRAIATRFPPTDKVNPRGLTEDLIKSSYSPFGFRTVKCNPVDDERNHAGICKDPYRLGFCGNAVTKPADN